MNEVRRIEGAAFVALPHTAGQFIRVRELRCRAVEVTTPLIADAGEIMRAARGETGALTTAVITAMVQHEVLINGVAKWFPIDCATFLAIHTALRGIDADRSPPPILPPSSEP